MNENFFLAIICIAHTNVNGYEMRFKSWARNA